MSLTAEEAQQQAQQQCNSKQEEGVVLPAEQAEEEEVIDEAVLSRNTILGKAVYFLSFAALACAIPYYPLFLHSRGFAPTAIGLIVSINPLATMFFVPPIAYLADLKHWNTPILLIGVIGGGAALVLGALGSNDVTRPIVSVATQLLSSTFPSTTMTPPPLSSANASSLATAAVGAVSLLGGEDSSTSSSATTTAEAPTFLVNTAVGLAMAAAGICLQSIFSSPVQPMIDHHAMALLPKSRKDVWALMRSYGAYGWGLFAPLAALVVEYYGFTYCFWAYLLVMLMACACLLKTTIVRPEPTDMDFKGVMRFITQKEQRGVLLMLTACSLMGVGMAIVSTYLFIFLDAELSAPKVLLGASVTVTVITEIPLFQNSAKVNALLSPQYMVMLAMVGWSVRVFLYSMLSDPWYVLAIEPFHGVTFGLCWLAGVRVVTTSYPPELAASAFGSLHAFVFGLGHVVGEIIGGMGYDALGPHNFFRVCACVMLLCAVLFWAIDKCCVVHISEGGIVSRTATPTTTRAAAQSQKQFELPAGAIVAASIVPSSHELGMMVEDARHPHSEEHH